jgi:uncharacterized protein with GYD domain
MSYYLMQFAYSADAWKALTENPIDRADAVKALAARLGAQVLGFYYSFGEYDGVVLLDAPDDATAAAISMAAASAGHLKATRTTPLLSVEQTIEALKKASAAGYRARTREVR